MSTYKKAFTMIGVGLGFLLWVLTKEPLMFLPPFFVCLGIGYLLEACSIKD